MRCIQNYQNQQKRKNKMLDKLKQYKLAIIAGVVALAYFFGIKRGKENEKAHQNNTLLANLQRANKARNSLADPNTTSKLHNKYRRK